MELTGHLGDVMKESAAIAYTFSKSFLAKIAPDNKFLHSAQIHVHVPEVNFPALAIIAIFLVKSSLPPANKVAGR